jgi:diguanylate cyclase (GGDEF)-like protein
MTIEQDESSHGLADRALEADALMLAASYSNQLVPDLPIAYGVLRDGLWQHFPSEGLLESLGISAERFSELNLSGLVEQRDRGNLEAWIATSPLARKNPFLFRSTDEGCTPRWLELWLAPHSLPEPGDSEPASYVLLNVDERARLQEEHEQLLDRLNGQLDIMYGALNAAQNSAAIWKAVRDSDGEIKTFSLVMINEAGAAPTGRMPRQLLRRNLEDVFNPEERAGLFDLFSQALETQSVQVKVVEINSPEGWVGAYKNTVAPFMHDQILASFRDISEERREQDRLHWLAEHDNLTGLPNRRGLDDLLEALLKRTRVGKTLAAFVFIDIDDFKRVNDVYGHNQGDVLLKRFASRLQDSVAESGIVSRLAGDEFAILLEGLDSESELRVQLDAVFESMREPFDFNEPPLHITCSAGATLCAGEEQVTDVLRITDKAMYRAKHDGKNRYTIVHI